MLKRAVLLGLLLMAAQFSAGCCCCGGGGCGGYVWRPYLFRRWGNGCCNTCNTCGTSCYTPTATCTQPGCGGGAPMMTDYSQPPLAPGNAPVMPNSVPLTRR
jgi:hypothetical protein